jgi:hypothetical protein
MPDLPKTQSAMLVQILQDVAEIKNETKRIADHETRLRFVERMLWLAMPVYAIACSIITAMVTTQIGN